MKQNARFLVVTTVLLLLNGFYGHSQRSKTALGISPGYVPEGFGTMASHNFYHNRTDFVKTSFLATFSQETIDPGITIPYNNFLLNIGYYTPLVKSSNNAITLAVGGGASFGYELVNNNEPNLSNGSLLLSESGFVIGGLVGLDLDVFLSDKLSLLVPLEAFYHLNSDLGSSMFFAGLGLRYYLN